MDYHVEVNPDVSPLSPKENEVFRLAAEGRLRPAIAKVLHRSPGTVNTHFNHILQKLNVANVQQAIAVGFIKGILACRDKLPLLVLVCVTTVGGVLPSPSYARVVNDWGVPPIDQPFQRSQQRGSGRFRTTSLMRLRVQTRIRENG